MLQKPQITALPLDTLDRIERSRELVSGVWRGLLVINLIGIATFAAIMLYTWIANPLQFQQATTGRPFQESASAILLVASPIVIVLNTLLLFSSERLSRRMLIVTSLLFTAFVALSAADNVFALKRNLDSFGNRPDFDAVAHTHFQLGVFYTLLNFLLLIPLLRITWAAMRDPNVGLLRPATETLKGNPWRWLAGWPAHLPSVGRGRRLAFFIFLLASLLFGFGLFVGLANLGLIAGGNVEVMRRARDGIDVQIPVSRTMIYVLLPLNLLLSLFIIVLFTWLSRLAERAAQARVRLSMTEMLASDTRAPVVFLRAFGDDQVGLLRSRSGFIARLVDLGSGSKRLDHIVLEEGFAFGPVVALGRPGEPFPPYGAARGYFQDADWQQAVAKLCRDAAGIVLCIDDTDGVWWEFDLIAGSDAIDRTLFLIHPRHAEGASNRQLIERMQARLPPGQQAHASDLMGEVLASAARGPVLGFHLTWKGAAVIGQSSRFDHRPYRIMTRAFLRSLPPSKPAA